MAIRYSTGPVENTGNNSSEAVTVKVLNNSRTRTATVRVNIFQLNGPKVEIFSERLVIPPLSSKFFLGINVSDTAQYEVEFIIQLENSQDEAIYAVVMPSVWGLDGNGNLIDVHRILTSELHLQERVNWFN